MLIVCSVSDRLQHPVGIHKGVLSLHRPTGPVAALVVLLAVPRGWVLDPIGEEAEAVRSLVDVSIVMNNMMAKQG